MPRAAPGGGACRPDGDYAAPRSAAGRRSAPPPVRPARRGAERLQRAFCAALARGEGRSKQRPLRDPSPPVSCVLRVAGLLHGDVIFAIGVLTGDALEAFWHTRDMVKPVVWIGTSREEVRAFPEEVRRAIGVALRQAQEGGKALAAKPLRGFGSANVLEIMDDFDGDTYRAVYTVRFSDVIYVLHAFQKKSKRGRKMPKHELDLIQRRLKMAEQVQRERALR
jgi:phage-related protein